MFGSTVQAIGCKSFVDMLKIGITQRVDIIESYQETRDTLDQRWEALFSEQGILMVPIPNTAEIPLFIENLSLNGLLISGGNDHPSRAHCETTCIDYCIQNQLPLLGICHGMQFIGRYFGAQCVPIENHVGRIHDICIANNPYKIPTGHFQVNSFHRFALDSVPKNFSSLATDNEGYCEAMMHKTLPIATFMWHPERPPFLPWVGTFLKNFYEQH